MQPPPTATLRPAPPTPAPIAQHPAPITASHESHAKALATASKDLDLNHIQLASQGGAGIVQLRPLGTAIKAIEAEAYLGSTGATYTPYALSTSVTTFSRAGQAQSAARPLPITANVTSVLSTPTHGSIPTVVASASSTHVPAPTPTRTMVPAAIPTTAILPEFATRPMSKWILPTEYVLIDRCSNGDIHLSTFYPFNAYFPAGGAMRFKPAHPITMRSVGVLSEICNSVSPCDETPPLAETAPHLIKNK